MTLITGCEEDVRDGMNGFERALKRIADIFLASVLLLFLSPLMLIIAVLIMRQRDGSVLFWQERIGRGGRTFNIMKFRTMPMNHEHDGIPRLEPNADEGQTELQRFLRVYHLDELPQLWNVLVGDMSFVGPRPERRYFVEQIMQKNPDYKYLFMIRPGVTSAATLYNGYTDTMEKMLVRLQMDLNYLKTRTLWVDVKIIFTTALYILNGKRI